jgi:hypothetical protein
LIAIMSTTDELSIVAFAVNGPQPAANGLGAFCYRVVRDTVSSRTITSTMVTSIVGLLSQDTVPRAGVAYGRRDFVETLDHVSMIPSGLTTR